ncbi:hypothetical protein PYW08_005803 [Mythimna loreyi]|uniref:Uncharacterized protein n=1 Tax=Mythimna loreyi TaxID=667449 RepID=A0ACC2QHP7_9NEOP|nr:hypothetical protein PYW08_005803 [Mythimna loreyi]
MFNLSDNYNLRKCFLQREQVPTQSMIREKMTPALAAVYFESMSPKLKVLAGLEPRLKGGGNNWYVAPDELLEGRVVLKPIRRDILSKLSSTAVETIGAALFQKHRKAMDLQIEQALIESDSDWRNNIIVRTNQLWDDLVAAATKKNTEHIRKLFHRFTYLYRQSLGKIEILFHESAISEIKNTRENAILEMKNKYSTILKHQATLLYDEYEKKLQEEKLILKNEFTHNLEVTRTDMADTIHDLNVDKHRAIETLKHCLRSQNLACAVYIALKEREECSQEIKMLKRIQKKKVDFMTETIQMQDFEIYLEQEKEKKREEFRNIWRKKVCHVLKSFQMFVSYCLHMLPEHAEFFINLEKLMLLQLNETLEDPEVASIIEEETEQFHTPVPQPKPFYLFCDRGYKAQAERNLCPKHSGTSTPSGIPVIIVNKRCLYAACDNFEKFGNKIREFIHGKRGDDADFQDDNVYEQLVPVKYGSSQKLFELKLESSLLQVLQQEVTNLEMDEDKAPVKCHSCGLPWCVPCPVPSPPAVPVYDVKKNKPGSSSIPSSTITSSKVSYEKLHLIGRSVKLDHEREPKWDSFCKYVRPKVCSCAKTTKKHLPENVPLYMRQMRYEQPEMPGYEMCSIEELKTLVEKARKVKKRGYPLVPVSMSSKTRDVGIQYYDPLIEEMCTCYSDDELTKFLNNVQLIVSPKYNFDTMSPSFLSRRVSSFAISRAQSLKKLVQNLSELKFMFKKGDNCDF